MLSPQNQNMKVYIRYLIKYCQKHNMKAILDGLSFLTIIFEETKNHSTVTCARSVLSTLIKPVNRA